MYSINKVMCEPYDHKGGVCSHIRAGFAVASQKTGIKGLKVLENAVIYIGNNIQHIMAGDIVYIREESLHTLQFAKDIYDIDQTKFILVPTQYIEIVDELGEK